MVARAQELEELQFVSRKQLYKRYSIVWISLIKDFMRSCGDNKDFKSSIEVVIETSSVCSKVQKNKCQTLCYEHFMQAMYCRICQHLLSSVKPMETCNAEAIGQKNEDANYEGSLLSARQTGGGRQTAKHRITGYSRTQIHNDNIKRP
uniref:Uncharacterized protein n=1 Tax=Glossina austeni TaxID=7395 RepID=A0A1A9UJB6_GLOAU